LPYPENIRELSDLFRILWQQITQEEIDNLIRRIRGEFYLISKALLFLVPFCIDLTENEWNYTCVSIMIPVLPFLFTNTNIINFFGAV
jgi:hypothetical protein